MNLLWYPNKWKAWSQDWRKNVLVQWPNTIVIHSNNATGFKKRVVVLVPVNLMKIRSLSILSFYFRVCNASFQKIRSKIKTEGKLHKNYPVQCIMTSAETTLPFRKTTVPSSLALSTWNISLMKPVYCQIIQCKFHIQKETAIFTSLSWNFCSLNPSVNTS